MTKSRTASNDKPRSWMFASLFATVYEMLTFNVPPKNGEYKDYLYTQNLETLLAGKLQLEDGQQR
jgi:hypothetical protein